VEYPRKSKLFCFFRVFRLLLGDRSAAEGAIVAASRADLAGWLFKEEPDHYCFADLERDRRTFWDGVANNLARQNLRQVRKGDRVLYYHTGKEKAVVGEMVVTSDPQPDPASDDPKAVGVQVKPVRRLQFPVTLKKLKAEPMLAEWELIRLPRLSIVPVTRAQWQRVEELSREGP
jgi:predicted RNA-binding protein with PUA-like domain